MRRAEGRQRIAHQKIAHSHKAVYQQRLEGCVGDHGSGFGYLYKADNGGHGCAFNYLN